MSSISPEVPYGDGFSVITRYCIGAATATTCSLLVSIGVIFTKNPFVKSIIKASAMKGLSDGAQETVAYIRSFAEEVNGDIVLIPSKNSSALDSSRIDKKSGIKKSKRSVVEVQKPISKPTPQFDSTLNSIYGMIGIMVLLITTLLLMSRSTGAMERKSESSMLMFESLLKYIQFNYH